MRYTIYAQNLRTKEVLDLGDFPTSDDAQWAINNNIEWDEDDDPTEWALFKVETSNFKGDWEEEEEWIEDPFDEVDFDPYAGCYIYGE